MHLLSSVKLKNIHCLHRCLHLWSAFSAHEEQRARNEEKRTDNCRQKYNDYTQLWYERVDGYKIIRPIPGNNGSSLLNVLILSEPETN